MPKKEKNKEEEIKELVIERLDVLPSDKKLSIGSGKEFTKEELIESVKRGDKIGKKITVFLIA